MTKSIETDILSMLLAHQTYASVALLHLKREYFEEPTCALMMSVIDKHASKYDAAPTKDELSSSLSDLRGKVKDELLDRAISESEKLAAPDHTVDYMLDRTERFCRDRAFNNALTTCYSIHVGEDKKTPKDACPDIMTKALSITFDDSVAYDYVEEAAARWEYYNNEVARTRFKIDEFNQITRGGLPKDADGGCLVVPIAGTNSGKSALLSALTADFANDGKNVLYISNEMGEIPIAERLDACILSTPIGKLKSLPKEFFVSSLQRIRRERLGQVELKQYPTRSAGARHFEMLLQDLKRRKNFVPDVIMLDYLNNCIPVTVRQDANSYERMKAIAEEIRGLSGKYKIPIIAPTQTNRSGQNNTDIELENVSESHGVSMTADLMFAIMRNEELDAAGQLLIKVVKNRMESRGVCTKFTVGFDFSRMTLYSTNDQSFAGSKDNGSVFDKTSVGTAINDENTRGWFND